MFKIGNAAPTIIINTDIIIFKIVFHLYMLVKLEASEIIVNKKALVIREMTRPPKVRPKKSNFGGRYFYVKIQL